MSQTGDRGEPRVPAVLRFEMIRIVLQTSIDGSQRRETVWGSTVTLIL